MNNLDLNISTRVNPDINPENASSRRTAFNMVQIKFQATTVYEFLTDYSKEYKNMQGMINTIFRRMPLLGREGREGD